MGARLTWYLLRCLCCWDVSGVDFCRLRAALVLRMGILRGLAAVLANLMGAWWNRQGIYLYGLPIKVDRAYFVS